MTRAGSRSPMTPRRLLPATVVDDTLAAAAILLEKWHPDEDSFGSSLLLDSTPDEVDAFLRAAKDLHRAMHFYASGATTTNDAFHAGGHGLIHAQELLDTAMRRLQRELQLLLTSLPDDLRFPQDDGDDDEDEDDDDQGEDPSLIDTCAHLRVVADAMMAAGYGKECVSIFKARRRAAVADNLQRLHDFSSSPQHAQLHTLSWEKVDTKIQSWLAGARVAFTSIFSEERELCDRVFLGDNEDVGDAVFGAIADDHATNILAVADAAIRRARGAPERLFRVLDVHNALTETILPAIVSSFGEKSEVTTRAVTLVTTKVSEAVRAMVSNFEAAIEKEPSKGTVPGGAVHPLTRYVMNYLTFLADYENALAHIYFYQQGVGADQFADTSSLASGSMGSSSELSSSSSSSPALSVWSNPIGWLVFVLLRKLDAKAGNYREPALGYLFLANNTHYVAKKVSGGTKLEGILGEEWVKAQRAKAHGYVDVYVRAAWGSKVLRGGAVEETVVKMVATQEKWVAADEEMGEALRAAAKEAVVPMYRLFYRRQGAVARLTPEDVITMIDGLFGGRNAVAGDESVAAAGRRRSSQQQQQEEVPIEFRNGKPRRQQLRITN